MEFKVKYILLISALHLRKSPFIFLDI